MSTISVRNSIIAAGETFQDNKSLEVDNIINASESIVAGDAGTAGAAGVMTLASGHGITDADTVAVIWAAGYRYGCTVSSYDSTSVTLTGGAGDTLPTSGAVVVAVQQEIDLAFSGTELKALSISSDCDVIATLEDAGGVELVKSISADSAYQWNYQNGEANPVTGDDIVKAHIYAKTANSGTAKILVGYDNN